MNKMYELDSIIADLINFKDLLNVVMNVTRRVFGLIPPRTTSSSIFS